MPGGGEINVNETLNSSKCEGTCHSAQGCSKNHKTRPNVGKKANKLGK